MGYTIREKYRNTDQESIFNSVFKLHEMIQDIAFLETKKSQGQYFLWQHS
jgi:hypothetical protein